MADKPKNALLESVMANLASAHEDPDAYASWDESRNAHAKSLGLDGVTEGPELDENGNVKKNGNEDDEDEVDVSGGAKRYHEPPELELPDRSTLAKKKKALTNAPDIAKHYAAAWNARGISPDSLDSHELAAVKGALTHTEGLIKWTGKQWVALHVTDGDEDVDEGETPKPSEVSKQPLTQPGQTKQTVAMSSLSQESFIELMATSLEPISLAQSSNVHHCPKGYTQDKPMRIAGKDFVGGNFIPASYYAQAPASVKLQIDAAKKESEGPDFQRQYESPSHKKKVTQDLMPAVISYLTKQGAGKRGKTVNVYDIQKATNANIDVVRAAVKELVSGNMVKREAIIEVSCVRR